MSQGIRVSRRTLIKGGSAAALLVSGAARGGEPAALVIYDSRSWQSRAFARRFRGGTLVDVAREHETLWASLRRDPPEGRVVGLTRWSDHVLARGYLEERRRRLRAERRLGELIYWEMT